MREASGGRAYVVRSTNGNDATELVLSAESMSFVDAISAKIAEACGVLYSVVKRDAELPAGAAGDVFSRTSTRPTLAVIRTPVPPPVRDLWKTVLLMGTLVGALGVVLALFWRVMQWDK